MNKVSKGNYYRLRTRKWLEKDGYVVFNMEQRQRIFNPKTKQVFFIARDIAGSDLMAMNGVDLIFVQVKSNKGHINQGLIELAKFPFPKFVKRWVVFWKPRAREPLIEEL